MTDEEKKEFEEFLEWKKQKKEKELSNQLSQPEKISSQAENHAPSKIHTVPNRHMNIYIVISLIILFFVIIFFVSSKYEYSGSKNNSNDGTTVEDSILVGDYSLNNNDSLKEYSSTTEIDTVDRINTLKKTLKIKSAYLKEPNSAGGVDAVFYYINRSDKTIKYLTWTGYAINAVGDMIACEVRDTYSFRGKDTGPVKPGMTGGGYWECAWYNWSAKKLNITQIEIEYMDGTTETIREPEIQYVK